MDLGLSEEQELLKNAARDFLEKECPESLVREMEDDEKGYSPDLWKKMAEQGWQGLLIPDSLGGAGFGYLDLIVLIEEFGRALVPGPFISTVIGGTLPLLEGGTDQQKSYALPKIASGETIWALAYTEPSARFDTEGITLEVKDGRAAGQVVFRFGEGQELVQSLQYVTVERDGLTYGYMNGMRPRGMLMYPMKKTGDDTLAGVMRWGGVEPPNHNGEFPPPEGITLKRVR